MSIAGPAVGNAATAGTAAIVKRYLPGMPAIASEIVAVLIGTVGAAYIISQFPALRKFVYDNSPVIRDQTGIPGANVSGADNGSPFIGP